MSTPPTRVAAVMLLALSVCATAPALGQPTAATAATGAAPAPLPPLGRLFFSAERRATLDRQRQMNIKDEQKAEDPTVTINGVVRRRSGPETAWINGVPQVASGPAAVWKGSVGPGAIRVLSPGEPAREVHVGETLHRASGAVGSPLNGGRITIRPTPPTRP